MQSQSVDKPKTIYLVVGGLSYEPKEAINLEKEFKMNLVDVTRLSNSPISDHQHGCNVGISWVQRENVIADPLRCLPCNRGMVLAERDANHIDGYLY